MCTVKNSELTRAIKLSSEELILELIFFNSPLGDCPGDEIISNYYFCSSFSILFALYRSYGSGKRCSSLINIDKNFQIYLSA
jgi:hypothetical protein